MIGQINVVSEKSSAKSEAAIHFVFESAPLKFDAQINQKLKQRDFSGKEGELVSMDDMIIVGAGKTADFNLVKWRTILADAFRYLQTNKIQSATIAYLDALGKDYFEIGKNLALTLLLVNYNFDYYKSEESKKKIKKILQLNFQLSTLNSQLTKGIEYGKLLSEGIYLTRDLVNQPASHTHPDTLEEQAFAIGKESKGKITVEVLDEDECRERGMGSFLGVAAGSERKPKFIILHYNNTAIQQSNNKKICLIGKSITFDSGGLSLKPSEHMETMKMDMAGGATVLGIFKILTRFDINKEIYGILPACENMPSGHALKPGDILTAVNKKTIEVLNTDAEGRLTLADALAYAEKYLEPDVIIDLATLTGACIVALGKHIVGMFGNDKKLLSDLEMMAQKEGEELWPMPLHKHYADSLKSPVADLKNIGGGKYGGGAITAALFLAEFVAKSKWIHLDIAGPAFNEGSAYGVTNQGGTGWGILTIIDFLEK